VKPAAFQSAFAQHIEGFIAHKRAIGYRYVSGAIILKQFDEFCRRYHGNEQILSKDIVAHWAERRAGESMGTLRIRVGLIRQFAIYLLKLGHDAYVTPLHTLPKYQRYVPYIFSNTELAAFFSQVDACRYWAANPVRHLVMPILFRMLYCCGLRVSEATNLKVNHVDVRTGVLTIYGGKFGKDRRVPMSEGMTNRCREYYARVHPFSDGDNYFLPSSSRGRPLPVGTVYFNFRKLLWDARISHGGKGKGPRLHDFRHTFAVHCLRNWVEEGKDLSAYLPVLKTYLGHTHFRETAYYLRLTADLYPTITAQVEQVFGNMIPHIGTLA
jgi:integrase/recombinase XerD